MAELLITPVEAGTSDEDVRGFLLKYGFPSFDRIERVPGAGERPAVLVSFDDCSAAALRALVPRIHQVFWKKHTINVLVMREPLP